jgi:hypothetical protein
VAPSNDDHLFTPTPVREQPKFVDPVTMACGTPARRINPSLFRNCFDERPLTRLAVVEIAGGIAAEIAAGIVLLARLPSDGRQA